MVNKVRKEISIFTRFTSNVRNFAKQLAIPQESYNELVKKTKKVNGNFKKNISLGQKIGIGLRKMTLGAKGFRMELLGIMFFGMGITRFFTGLLGPALHLSGLFELFSQVLAILFLPVALYLLELLLPLFKWLINLSDGTKLMIGKFILFAAAAGAVLFVIGMFGLGIGALILVFGGFLGIIEKLIPGPLGDIAAALVGITIAGFGFKSVEKIWGKAEGVFQGLLDKLLELPFVKDLFDNLGISIEELKNPMEIIREKVISLFDEMVEKLGITEEWENFKTLAEDIKDVFQDFMDLDWSELTTSLSEIANLAKEIVDSGLLPAVGFLIKGGGRIARGVGILTENPQATSTGVFLGSGLGPAGQIAGGSVAAGLAPIFSPTINITAVDKTAILKELNDSVSSELDRINRR